jgi:hypothetical protein
VPEAAVPEAEAPARAGCAFAADGANDAANDGTDQAALLRLGRRLARSRSLGLLYAGQLLKIRDRNGALQPLHANTMQRNFEARRGQHNIVLKARQMGMTTWIAGQFFLRTILQPGVLTVQVAHTREAAEGIFGVVQRMWENLPQPLRRGPLRRSRANVGQMVFPALDSEFRVVSAGEPSAGRGLTIQNLHCSELSRWPGDAAATLAGLRAALAPGGASCLESTACGAYGCFYEEWERAHETGAVRHFFPWWMEPAYSGDPVADLRPDERELMLLHGLSTRQIGFRRTLEKSYRGLRMQEFAEDAASCFKATGDCCFELAAIERRLAEVPPPLEARRGGALRIWLPALGGKEYLVAVDTAGGGADGDFGAVQVIELASGMQCAELRERLTPLELARAAAALGREYAGPGGGALIAVERNNHGAAVLAYLDVTEHYPRIYGQAGVAGWLTSAGSKPAMVSRLGALLEDSPGMFLSKRLLRECRTFISFPGGRTGAASGSHDDCLMAMAVAQAVRAERSARW